jgi:Big-like domain-containing protein
MRHLRPLVLLATVVGCGGDEGSSGPNTSPSGTTTTVAVTVPAPVRMGQTAQASGNETLSGGQTRSITSGWLSDAPGVATVTTAGLVTGVANGRATIYVVAGGRQGQQVVRVVPDYQGTWSGGLRVTSCTGTGIFERQRGRSSGAGHHCHDEDECDRAASRWRCAVE